MSADGHDTKALLVDVAEEQFGLHGLEGVSLREIGRLAGCANTGAVRYHFGGRQGLIDAIFQSRLALMERERGALLAQAQAHAGPLDVRALLEILYRPFERQRSRSGKRSYAAFLAGLARTGEIAAWIPHGASLVTTRRVTQYLQAALPGLGEDLYRQRTLALSIMIWHALMDFDRRRDALPTFDQEAAFQDLMTMAAAALTASEPRS